MSNLLKISLRSVIKSPCLHPAQESIASIITKSAKSARSLFTSSLARPNEQSSPHPLLLQCQIRKNSGHREVEDFIDLKVDRQEKQTIVEAVPRPTGREGLVVNTPDGNCSSCALCRLNLRGLKYTDVLILSQFIKRDGSIATHHESKLCYKQYALVQRCIKQAQRCNLIKRGDDYFVPGPWHDLNTYIERDRRRDDAMKVIKKDYWNIQ